MIIQSGVSLELKGRRRAKILLPAGDDAKQNKGLELEKP